jgi:hypothetical protein
MAVSVDVDEGVGVAVGAGGTRLFGDSSTIRPAERLPPQAARDLCLVSAQTTVLGGHHPDLERSRVLSLTFVRFSLDP